jgi:DNA primase large subunit
MLNVGNSSNVRAIQRKQPTTRFSLSMYQEPPQVEVTLDKFESYSIDRLQMLKILELQRLRGSSNAAESQAKIEKSLNKYLPMRTAEDREKDELSHFILRMAFCHTEELRRWFLSHESMLFKYRLDKATREDKMNFMKTNGLFYDQVS